MVDLHFGDTMGGPPVAQLRKGRDLMLRSIISKRVRRERTMTALLVLTFLAPTVFFSAQPVEAQGRRGSSVRSSGASRSGAVRQSSGRSSRSSAVRSSRQSAGRSPSRSSSRSATRSAPSRARQTPSRSNRQAAPRRQAAPARASRGRTQRAARPTTPRTSVGRSGTRSNVGRASVGRSNRSNVGRSNIVRPSVDRSGIGRTGSRVDRTGSQGTVRGNRTPVRSAPAIGRDRVSSRGGSVYSGSNRGRGSTVDRRRPSRSAVATERSSRGSRGARDVAPGVRSLSDAYRRVFDDKRTPQNSRISRVEDDFLRSLGQRFGLERTRVGATRDLPRLTVGPRSGTASRSASALATKRGGIVIPGDNSLASKRAGGRGSIEFANKGGVAKPGTGTIGTPIVSGTTPTLAPAISSAPFTGVAARLPNPFTGVVGSGTVPPSASAFGSSVVVGTSLGTAYDPYPSGYASYGYGSSYSGYGLSVGFGYGGYGYGYFGYGLGCGYLPYSYRCSSSYWYRPSLCFGSRPYSYRYRCYSSPYYGYSYYPGYHVFQCDDDYYYRDTTYIFYGRAAVESDDARGILENLSDGELSFCEGWGLLAKGEYEDSARALAAALEKLPRQGLAAFFAGVALAGAGEYDLAAAAFETSVREHPSIVTYTWDADEHLGSHERFQTLVDTLTSAAKSDPSRSSRWVSLAAVAQMGGQSDVARRAAGEAIFSDSESAFGEAVLAELTRRDEGAPLDPLVNGDSAISNWLVNPSCESIPRLRLTEPLTF